MISLESLNHVEDNLQCVHVLAERDMAHGRRSYSCCMAPRFLDHRCTGFFAYGISHTSSRVLESVYGMSEAGSGAQVSKSYRGQTTKSDAPTV